MIWVVSAHAREGMDSHTFGYFHSFRKAWEAVETNACDMQECLYEDLVIEAVKPGIHGTVVSEHWYKWDGKQWRATPRKKPAWAKGVCNFGIG